MEELYLEQWLNGQYEVMRFTPRKCEFVMITPLRMAKGALTIEMIMNTSQIPELQYASGYASIDLSNKPPNHWRNLYQDTLQRGWKPSKSVYFQQLKILYDELPNPAN